MNICRSQNKHGRAASFLRGDGESGSLVDDRSLGSALDLIRDEFDIREILERRINAKSTLRYYRCSDYGYKHFHSREGAIHLALNFDGYFDEAGYLWQSKFVEQHLPIREGMQVLELACGWGYNAIHLARRNGSAEIAALDLTRRHVSQARRAAKSIPNLRFMRADFESMDFDPRTFDVVFAVEGICYARDMGRVLEGIYKILRPAGTLVIIDFFRADNFTQLPGDVRFAAKVTEASMALGEGWQQRRWLALAESVGFVVVESLDLSDAVMPNLKRLQHLALKFFDRRRWSRIKTLPLPRILAENSIAGLLMPFTFRLGAHVYLGVVLRRPEDGDNRIPEMRHRRDV